MAIKAGSIIHVGNGVVLLDRIQTAGPGQVNVPTETVYELGDYKSVGQIRDIPDLSFSMASYDVTTEMEALLLGMNALPAASTQMDLATSVPLDLASVFKAGQNALTPYAEVGSVAIPYLTLESMEYSYGLTSDAQQTATLRGDSIYYNPGSTYTEVTAGSGTAGQTVATAHPAYGTTEGGVSRRVLNVEAGTKRLLYGVDYTEAYGTVTNNAAVTTLTLAAAVDPSQNIRIQYSSPTSDTFPQSVHPTTAVKPAAIRGRDIAVYLGGYDPANPFTNRLLGVQSFQGTWRVTLDKDLEFGNYHVVNQDFDVPEVSGTIGVKPVDVPALVAYMQRIGGASAFQSATASAAPIIPLDVVLHDPVTGNTLKHLSIPDARFTVPGFSARVQQKLDFTVNWTSDQGNLLVSGV